MDGAKFWPIFIAKYKTIYCNIQDSSLVIYQNRSTKNRPKNIKGKNCHEPQIQKFPTQLWDITSWWVSLSLYPPYARYFKPILIFLV